MGAVSYAVPLCVPPPSAVQLDSYRSPFLSPLRIQDKFTQLLNLLPDLKVMAQRGEDFLYFKHMQVRISVSIVVMLYICRIGCRSLLGLELLSLT